MTSSAVTRSDASLMTAARTDCRSLNAAGTHWHCYVGQAAVREKIIGQGFLGQVSYGPARADPPWGVRATARACRRSA
jgi:hypothetical protein